MGSSKGGLWRHPEFMRLWVGQTVSQFGSHITGEALPLTAVLLLSASPAQMGLLGALGAAPMLAISLLAGLWVDRVRRKPVMIAADLGRALILATVPLGWLLGKLQIELLYLVALIAGALTVLFDIAYQSYLPSLVQREHIVEGNSKLSLSSSLAEITGPAIGGSLVQIISAPLTILIDTISFLFSALSIGRTRKAEPTPAPASLSESLAREITAGIRYIGRDRLLRPLVGSASLLEFFGSFIGALYGLFVIREVGLSPAMLGILVGSGGFGALLGATITGRVTRRFGPGRAVTTSLLLLPALSLLIPLAGGTKLLAAGMLLASQVAGDLVRAVYSINEISLRQGATPDAWLGRVNASTQFLVGGVGTLGLLAGGLLGEALGMRATLFAALAGQLLAGIVLFISPVRRLDETPRSVDGQDE